jgi:hypothetical protein
MNLGLERLNVRDMLHDVGAENDVKVGVGVREVPAVIYLDRPSPRNLISAAGNINGFHFPAPLGNGAGLIAGSRADLEYSPLGREKRDCSPQLELANALCTVHVKCVLLAGNVVQCAKPPSRVRIEARSCPGTVNE